MATARTSLLLAACLLLSGCAALPTYADAQATAITSGCWPDPLPTPRPITVTPVGGPVPTPDPDLTPTAGAAPTRLPTTTPLPRCTPQPGATAVPWPTPIPNPPPYPTMEARSWLTGADLQTTLHLPGTVLTVAMAAHPTDDWVAVAGVVWSGTLDHDRVIVSVLNPATHGWSLARQVDLGDSHIGNYSRSVATAITGDGVVHVAWASSDPDFRDNDPPAGAWLSESQDFGDHWSAPTRIATDCPRVDDMRGTATGELAVLLTCEAGPQSGQPVVLVRGATGAWLAPERLPLTVWRYSEGALAITGDRADQRLVGVVLGERNGAPVAHLFWRPLAGTSRVQTLTIQPPAGHPVGLRMTYPRAAAYTRRLPDGTTQQGVSISWTSLEQETGLAFGVTSLDGGITWGPVETLVDLANLGLARSTVLSSPLAYDAATDRLITVWTCCEDTRWAVAPTTHFARWSAPGSGVWWQLGASDMPLAIGSRVAAETVAAQSANSPHVWIAWVEAQQRIEVRSLTLDQLVPAPTGGGF